MAAAIHWGRVSVVEEGRGEGKAFYSPTARLVFEFWECEVTAPN